MTPSRKPIDLRPPFTRETALAKVKAAEDAWNSRDPERVAEAYSEDSRWRNRSEFFEGRASIVEFLRRKWAKELDDRLMKELWSFTDNRISVRFECEWHHSTGEWYRTHGNEHWEFDEDGRMRCRDMSANDVRIEIDGRRISPRVRPLVDGCPDESSIVPPRRRRSEEAAE
jgi:nuclear transport factor 2 (NTF2) superfamily protein